MSTQKLKAKARRSAKSSDKSDPETGRRAEQDAASEVRTGESSVQPVYATQTTKGGGRNIHRSKHKPMSEFDDPAENTCQNESD